MRVRPFRIPKQVVLPGLVVQVRLWMRHTPELEGDAAAWQYDGDGKAIIYIVADLPIEVQRYLVIHELGHVMWDYMHVALISHPDVIQAGG